MKRAVILCLALSGFAGACGRSHPLGAPKNDAGRDATTAPPPATDGGAPTTTSPDDASADDAFTDDADALTAPTADALPEDAPVIGQHQCRPGATYAGVCTCRPETPTLCPVSCNNLQTDSDNCGACGHACPPTSTCNAGVCGEEPVHAFAYVGTACGELAFADGVLYWAASGGGGHVGSWDLTNDEPGPLNLDEVGPTRILARGHDVFWAAGADHATIRWSHAGGAPTDAYKDTVNLSGFTVSDAGDRIYFPKGSEVRAVAPGGAVSTVVAKAAGGSEPYALSLIDRRLAWKDDQGGVIVAIVSPGQIAQCDPALANEPLVSCLKVADGLLGYPMFQPIVQVADSVLWADWGNVRWAFPDRAGAMVRANVGGTITALAAAGETIWFAVSTQGPLGVVYRQAHKLGETSPPVAIARGQMTPGSLVVGGGRVFWTTGDCQIWSAKM
jgi:hypothetical protein